MKIRSVHHVQIIVPDVCVEKARHFYTEVLELVQIPKPAELPNQKGFWLELGKIQIHVGVGTQITNPNSREHVAFLVDNLEHWRSRLSKEGVKVIKGVSIPGFERLEFRDPAGNRIEFLEAKQN